MGSRYKLARYAGWKPSLACRLLPEIVASYFGKGPGWPVFLKDQELTFDREGNEGMVFLADSVEDFDRYAGAFDYHIFAADVDIMVSEPSDFPRFTYDGLTTDPGFLLYCRLGGDDDPLGVEGTFEAMLLGTDPVPAPLRADLLMRCRTENSQIVKKVLRMYV